MSLSDSLAAGFQPDGTVGQGYAGQLFTILQAKIPTLQHVKFGCYGEATVTITSGGACPYSHGTQLTEAVAFVQANKKSVVLLTIDIGANDVNYELRLSRVGNEFSGTGLAPESTARVGVTSDYKYSWRHECRDTDPGDLVYTKQELVTPEHTLEAPLQPDSLYFWTVRAHFTLDGKRRTTEWSEQLPDLTENPVVGFQNQEDGCSYPATFHLIRTPKEQDY